MGTKSSIRQRLNDGDISQQQVNKFYDSTIAFYERAMEYAVQNLPLNDTLLKNATFVNFKSRENVTFSQVEFFIQRY